MPEPAASPVTLIIPCSGAKASEPKPARDLYTGAMYRHTLTAVLAVADWCLDRGIPARILILSALHGLTGLDEVLAPYDVKMGAPGSVTAVAIAGQARRLGIAPGEDIRAFLPRPYLARLDEALRDLGVTARDMYKGARGIGEQRHVNAGVTRQPGSCFHGGPFPAPAAPARPGPQGEPGSHLQCR